MVTCRPWASLGWALSLSLAFGVLTSVPPQLTAQTSVVLPKELHSVPLPNDIHIVSPQADVPLDLAAFSGVWGGLWSYASHMPTILVVESVTTEGSPQAVVIYAWGAGGPAAPGYFRVRANFVNGELHVAIPPGSRMTYRMRPDGRLDGTHAYQQYSAQAILKRICGGVLTTC
jgi:hypothetical protein